MAFSLCCRSGFIANHLGMYTCIPADFAFTSNSRCRKQFPLIVICTSCILIKLVKELHLYFAFIEALFKIKNKNLMTIEEGWDPQS